MESIKTSIKSSKVISMSAQTKEKIDAVANSMKGKDLFTDKIAFAKKAISELKSLPI